MIVSVSLNQLVVLSTTKCNMQYQNKQKGYLRTELVFILHSSCKLFPSTNATSFPVTSSRLGVSVSPTLSTFLTDSDLKCEK